MLDVEALTNALQTTGKADLAHALGQYEQNRLPLAQALGQKSQRSAEPAELPLIDPGYLRDPDQRDLAVLVEGLHLARQLAQAPALADWLTQELGLAPNSEPPMSSASTSTASPGGISALPTGDFISSG